MHSTDYCLWGHMKTDSFVQGLWSYFTAAYFCAQVLKLLCRMYIKQRQVFVKFRRKLKTIQPSKTLNVFIGLLLLSQLGFKCNLFPDDIITTTGTAKIVDFPYTTWLNFPKSSLNFVHYFFLVISKQDTSKKTAWYPRPRTHNVNGKEVIGPFYASQIQNWYVKWIAKTDRKWPLLFNHCRVTHAFKNKPILKGSKMAGVLKAGAFNVPSNRME